MITFDLPTLNFNYDALEPYIDARTMEIHHTKHHQAYINNFKKAVEDNQIKLSTYEELFSNISKFPAVVRNNAGGHYNHSLFWEILSPNAGGEPTGGLLDAINRDFGSFESFKELFSAAAASRFGSGWAWLVVSNGKLFVTSTPNQDNPLMDVAEVKGTPVLGLDVWEHAYYLNYQNRRPDYISAFWNLVNWNLVSEKFNSAK